MKLELKHVAPYLPYGLKCMSKDKSQTIWELGPENIKHALTWWKPLLIPMSELTPTFLVYGFEGVSCYFSKNDINKIVAEGMPLDYVPYGQLLRLVSWHFDVFNLIPSGVALNKLDFLAP